MPVGEVPIPEMEAEVTGNITWAQGKSSVGISALLSV